MKRWILVIMVTFILFSLVGNISDISIPAITDSILQENLKGKSSQSQNNEQQELALPVKEKHFNT